MSGTKKRERKRRAVGSGGQLPLSGVGIRAESDLAGENRGVRFNDPDPRKLYVGEQHLDEFLRQMGFSDVFKLREILRSLDLSEILSKYKGTRGRRPYHPAGMLGLIMLGIMEGKSSLRELETMGRIDVRSWWLTGGVMPNYSVICRFINNNAEVLTEGFFEQVTGEIIKRTSSKAGSVSIDGTTIQAAASRYKTLKREAAEKAAKKARRAADQQPDDAVLEEKAKQAEQVSAVAKERSEKKKRKDKDAQVSPSEPDAVVQQLKTKAVAPSYKGSVAANEDRIITANKLHPTSETAVVPGLIEQTERVSGERVTEVMEDAGYHCGSVLNHALEHDINILCPHGQTQNKQGDWEKKSEKLFLKNRFRFDEKNDVYICPADQRLEREHKYKGNANNPAYVKYVCQVCETCPLHNRCTKSANRGIKRYEDDEVKEAMREVMKQPGAKERYKKRQAMVEPVFGEQRYIQGLQRFKRRGLRKVTLEYSLHCSAHNLRRYFRLSQAAMATDGRYAPKSMLLSLFRRLSDQIWRLRMLSARIEPRESNVALTAA